MNNNFANKQNLFKAENLENLTISEVVEEMFALTDKNGELIIEGLGGDFTYEGDFYQFKMKWNKSDCAKIIAEMEKFADEIVKIAGISDDKERKILADTLFQNNVAYVGTAYDRIVNVFLNFSNAYASRFFKSVMLGAPEIIKNNERNHMVQAIVVNLYGECVGLV